MTPMLPKQARQSNWSKAEAKELGSNAAPALPLCSYLHPVPIGLVTPEVEIAFEKIDPHKLSSPTGITALSLVYKQVIAFAKVDG